MLKKKKKKFWHATLCVRTSWGVLDVASVVVHYDTQYDIKWSTVTSDACFWCWCHMSVRSGCYSLTIVWTQHEWVSQGFTVVICCNNTAMVGVWLQGTFEMHVISNNLQFFKYLRKLTKWRSKGSADTSTLFSHVTEINRCCYKQSFEISCCHLHNSASRVRTPLYNCKTQVKTIILDALRTKVQ